jgi:hypothetical protein
MVGSTKPRAIGFNHVALEVGDIYGRIFDFHARQEQDDGLHRSWRPIHRVAGGTPTARR